MTCKHRIVGSYLPECNYSGECLLKDAGAYLPTCSDPTAPQPQSVRVVKVETKPEKDPYTGGVSYSLLEINPEKREVYVTQAYRSNSTSIRLYNGLDLSSKVSGHPDEDDLRQYLMGVGQIVLKTIVDNHSIHWNGHNHVGSLNDVGRTAFEELQLDLEEMGDKYSFWGIEDWLYGSEVTPESSDALIDTLVKEYTALAEAENIVLDGDIKTYLLEVRAG